MMLAFGCCKAPIEEPLAETPFYVGTAKWELDNDISDGLASAINERFANAGDYSVHFYRNFTAQNFHFTGVKLELGTQQLVTGVVQPAANIPTADFYHAHGDAIYDTYHLIELDSVENYFEITSIDPKTNAVEGKFQAAFAIDSPDFTPNPAGDPDTVVFRNGSFKTLIGK
jgi:hypothetical protein